MYAENAYIALYDDQRQALNFPYYKDSVDTDIPDPNVWEPLGSGQASGVTAYALRLGKPIRIEPGVSSRAGRQGRVQDARRRR